MENKKKVRYTFWVDQEVWKKFLTHIEEEKFQTNKVLEHLIRDYLSKLEF